MNRKTAILILVFVLSVSLAWAIRGFIANSEIGDERSRANERLVAAEAGWMSAMGATKGELKSRIEDYQLLSDAYDSLQDHVSKLKPVTVTKWQTKEIKVPVEKIVNVPVEKLVSVEVPGDCPLPPTVSFDIRGAQATLESRKGNLFAIGQAELWRVDPPPETLLGIAAWEDSVTEISALRAAGPPWRVSLLFGTSDDADYRLGATYNRRGRLGLWVLGSYDPNPDSRQFSYLVPYRSTNRGDVRTDIWQDNHYGFAAGVSLTLGRK